MGWNKMHNVEADNPHITHSGICKYNGKQAEVTSFFSGIIECKTDLQKTYRFKGYKCSLQEKKGVPDLVCIDECPLIRKEYP